jgi:curved DNA-binding protein CbpA
MPRIKTFYDELGIERTANAAQIKHAFKETAKIYHPDKNPPDKQRWAHEQMSRLNFIVDTLLNPATRREYDSLVRKYEALPVVARRRRPVREQNAIEREYARVSVEIMNLAGKYSNCRLKMMIGAIIGSFGAITHLAGYVSPFSAYAEMFPMTFAFTYFFALIGGVMVVIGISDYLGRTQYRQRIRELEQRRSHLRQRMYEVLVSY